MKVKITQPGWETYSSDLGTVQFHNGVSVEDISEREALALGAHVSLVEVDGEGKELGPVNPAYQVLRATTIGASVTKEMPRMTDEKVKACPVSPPVEQAPPATEAQPAKVYAKAELEAIATAKGIAGLREIGALLNVRNTSVKGLIAEILEAQEKAK